jgi:hypothetical protein
MAAAPLPQAIFPPAERSCSLQRGWRSSTLRSTPLTFGDRPLLDGSRVWTVRDWDRAMKFVARNDEDLDQTDVPPEN